MSRSELTLNQVKGKSRVAHASVGRLKPPGAWLRASRGTVRENADMPGKNAAVLGICRDYSSVKNADQRRNMKTHKLGLSLLALLVVGTLIGCSTSTQSPDVSDNIRKSLDQAGLKDVTITQDRDKGVVTLGGHVAAETDKTQAESLAKSIAGEQVIANQIAVTPPGVEKEAKTVNSDLDTGIEKNLDAALITNKLHKVVKFDVKNGVVKLSGEVNSRTERARAEKVASSVPNVSQVVNELEVKNQKATSSK
jgi:hyperosmotically inducible periplasmic protein